MLETLHWHPVDEQLPDDEITVLLLAPTADEPVWPGYRDGDDWRWVDGSIVADGSIVRVPVTHSTYMPADKELP